MLYLACYDIEVDKIRLKVADCLLAAGLERLQRSVFVGSLSIRLREQVTLEVKHLLAGADGSTNQFMLMPLAESYVRDAYWLGAEPPDWSYHLNETLTLII